MWQIVVPGVAFYHPPIECDRLSAAVRRAKQIATAYPHSTVDVYRDGVPVFALGASRFGGCAAGVTPSRCWSKVNV